MAGDKVNLQKEKQSDVFILIRPNPYLVIIAIPLTISHSTSLPFSPNTLSTPTPCRVDVDSKRHNDSKTVCGYGLQHIIVVQ
jgi:hypothetical protein